MSKYLDAIALKQPLTVDLYAPAVFIAADMWPHSVSDMIYLAFFVSQLCLPCINKHKLPLWRNYEQVRVFRWSTANICFICFVFFSLLAGNVEAFECLHSS